MKTIIVTDNSYAISDKTTYRQLKDLLPDTDNVKTPSEHWVRENTPICSVKFDGGDANVYANGFYTYATGENSTILRVDGFSYIKYSFGDGEASIVKEEEYADQPFAVALALNGEKQLERNFDKRKQYHQSLYVDNENDCFLEDIVTPDFATVNETIEEEME